jgi:hypothetical protein
VAQIGGAENLYTLSDPNVREHVRRMTTMQVRSSELGVFVLSMSGCGMWTLNCVVSLCFSMCGGQLCIQELHIYHKF